MKIKIKIFNILFYVIVSTVFTVERAMGIDYDLGVKFKPLSFTPSFVPTIATVSSYDTDADECGYFNPTYALCSTHSHNAGYVDPDTKLPANPTKSEEVSQMNHIIALKSTLIAQQLKEQYDTLNVIIKRFKTQLEKAVLVSKIEVVTGNAASGNSGGGSSGSGSGSNTGLASAEDCSMISDYGKVFDCVIGNLQKVKQVATSDTTNARKQLGIDLGVMDMYTMCKDSSGKTVQCSPDATFKTNCPGLSTSGGSISGSKIPSCVAWLNAQVTRAKQDYVNSLPRGYWGP